MNAVACRQCSPSKLHTHMFLSASVLLFQCDGIHRCTRILFRSGPFGRARVITPPQTLTPAPRQCAASTRATSTVRSGLMPGGAARVHCTALRQCVWCVRRGAARPHGLMPRVYGIFGSLCKEHQLDQPRRLRRVWGHVSLSWG